MKNLKIIRILASILTIVLFSNTLVFAAQTVETALYPDNRSLEILKALGVLNDNDILEDDEWITRAQAAHFAAALTGIASQGATITEKYTDVNAKTDYAQDIIFLSDLGVFHGYGDGTFRPNDNISSVEMIKVLLSAAGYTIPAEAGGGYMSGYLKYASATGLTDGLEGDLYEAIEFSDVITLLFNALEIEVMTSDVYSPDSITVSASRDKTVLTELLHIYKDDGIISANSISSLTASGGCEQGQVIIENVPFDVGHTDADKLLGHNVTYYYKEASSGDYLLLYVYVAVGDKTLVISSDDFEQYTGSAFEYYDNNKTKSARVNNRTCIIYNNRPMNIGTGFSLSNGTIELIDNNSDSVYDVVFIKEYRNIYAQQIDYKNGVIYDAFDIDNPLKIDTSMVGETVMIYNRKGESIALDNIKFNSLLCCLISNDSDCIIINEVVNEIIGKIENTEIVNGITNVVIDGVSYEISDELAKTNPEWVIGDKIICYLDMDGKIAALSDKKTSKYHWAILEDVYVKVGLSGAISIKIFDEDSDDGEMSIFEISDKLIVDDNTYTESQLAKESRESILAKLGGARNLIMYAKNANNEVNYIYTENSDQIYRYSDYTTYLTNRNTSILGGQVGYNGSTLLFSVPSANVSEERYRVRYAASSLSHQTEYSLKVYKTSADNLDADVLVRRTGATTSPGRSSPTLLIDEVVMAINEEGETIQRVYGYSGSAYVSYETVDGDTMNNMTAFGGSSSVKYSALRGDMVIFALDKGEKISSAKLLCRGSDNGGKIYSTSNPSTSSYNNSQRLMFGGVYKKDGLAFQVTTLSDLSAVTDSNLELYKIISDTNVYVYEKAVGTSQDRVRSGSVNDLLDYATDEINYSRVAVYTDTGKINAILIIK